MDYLDASSTSARAARLALIAAIEEARGSRLITYVVGDRQGLHAQIGEDAVRPMYKHLLELQEDEVPCIDLFLYSRGGAVEVPWRIVSMLREYCHELNVLVPYKAHSAATLIALGADNIVMGRKGELGPIDPSTSRLEDNEGTVTREDLSVEDVMSYIDFVRQRVGLSDQAALSSSVAILAEKLRPWRLGSIYRTHSHIRLVARKLLAAHSTPPDAQRTNAIVESLAEKMYLHGHAIARKEAEQIGLPIVKPDTALEANMWRLFEAYEQLLALDQPIDPHSAIPDGQEEAIYPVILACIESRAGLDACNGRLKFRHVREQPQNLNLNLNVNLQLPPGVPPQSIPDAAAASAQQLLQQLQGQLAQLIMEQVRRQAPIRKTEGLLVDVAWRDLADAGI